MEKGRQTSPRFERKEHKCFNCQNDIADECHLVTECPLHDEEPDLLFDV